LEPSDPGEVEVLRTLHEWDGQVAADSAGAAIYEVWLAALVETALEPLVGDELTGWLMGRSRSPIGVVAEHGGRIQVTLVEALERGDPTFGERRELLSLSLTAATRRLVRTLGDRVAGWRWGRLHRLNLRHALASVPVLGWLFRAPSLEMGGDADTPCQFHPVLRPGRLPSDCSWSPGWRHVVDLGEPERAATAHAGGQSGRLLSAHRLDGLRPWHRGELQPNWMTPEDVRANTERQVRLTP
ncbi:MAG: penicillin acylase family protein, partial [Candidatus Eremiobacterota bacterium]